MNIFILLAIFCGVFGKFSESQRVTTEEKEIILLPEKVCFKRAQQLCKSKGYHLVTIENEDINKMVYDAAVSNNIGRYWIDANDAKNEGTFINSNREKINYKKFAKGEPNNYRNEDCIHGLFYPNGLWNDISCSTQNSVICSKEKITEENTVNVNSTYQVHAARVTYQEALDFCQKHNCRIVKIEDEIKNKLIFELAVKSKIETYWINGNDMVTEGRWVDNSGKLLTYKNWFGGEPNNYNNEDCLQGRYYPDGKWNDIDCNTKNSFIYEQEIEMVETEITIHDMNIKLNYEEAVAMCKRKGLKMIKIESEERNNIVYEFAVKNRVGTYWIDSNDIKVENRFVYANGQNITYRKFPNGAPDNRNNEDCIVGLSYPHGFWNDVSCQSQHSVICYESKSGSGTTEVTTTVSGKYFIHSRKITYQEAQDYCQVHNCRLISVQNAETDKILFQLAKKHGIGGYWIDGTDVTTEGQWLNSEGKKLTYLNWHQGEPNNWQEEDCLQGNFYDDGTWNDISCLTRNSFIYEYIETVVIKTDLEIILEKVTFTEAKELCTSRGYTLISIDNEDTNKEVYEFAVQNKIGSYWIDANDIKVEGTFVNGEDNKIKYSKFYRGEPNNLNNEDCVHGLFYPNGYWNDIDCNTKNAVICTKYRPPITSVDEHTNYNIFTQKVTFEEAVMLCKKLDYDLLQIDDIERNSIAVGLSTKHNLDSYWIDGTDAKTEGKWLNLKGETLKFQNWKSNDKLTNSGLNCIRGGRGLNGKWENLSCKSQHSVICYRDSKEIIKGGAENEIIYYIHKGKVTFTEAVNYCKKNTCQLVTIEDKDTDIKIWNTAKSLKIGRYWIDGRFSTEKRQWLNYEGRNLTYFNWHNGKSNNCKKQHCIEGNRFSDGTWNHVACCTKNSFIYKIKMEKKEPCI